MIRKKRQNITKEQYDLIFSMANKHKFSNAKIAETLNIDRKTVSKYLKTNQEMKIFKTAATKVKETCTRRNSVYNELEQTINNIVACENDVILKEIQSKIYENLQKTVSISTISRKLKKMKITRKRLTLVPYERNTIEKINARAIYATEISRIQDENLVFLDETGFNQHTKRSYGYSFENTKAFKLVPANRNINRSLMCVINLHGVVAFSVKTGSYNAVCFIDFIQEKLIPFFQTHPNNILVMDNARIHHSLDVINFLRIHNIPFRFLVAYSPELNPIEEFFSMLKSRFYALKNENPEYTIEQCLHFLLDISNNFSRECRGFYLNMRRWVEKARLREPFI